MADGRLLTDAQYAELYTSEDKNVKIEHGNSALIEQATAYKCDEQGASDEKSASSETARSNSSQELHAVENSPNLPQSTDSRQKETPNA